MMNKIALFTVCLLAINGLAETNTAQDSHYEATLTKENIAQDVATQHTVSKYRIIDLLEPCVEGDNDSRWGAEAESECEQYIIGFTDAFVLSDRDRAICLPPVGNRADEVRWAFVKWAHDNYDLRKLPASEGLIRTLKTAFKCK